MGEIFARPRPSHNQVFTGERLTPDIPGQIAFEHLHRYMLAREYCRGKDVLDVASGEGYGSALLAQIAQSVVGVEIAAETVAHATANYGGAGLRFVCGDARHLPLATASVDVVVSFETIEHFDRQDAFVAEALRVLRPGGLFIVSTPDRDTYSPADEPANPYHIREMTREEFATLLHQRFANVAMCWQRTLAGSAILPGPNVTITAESMCFERHGDGHFEGSVGFPRPQYLVALCSDAALPPVAGSIYIDYSRLHRHEQEWQEKLNAEYTRWKALTVSAEETRTQFDAAEAALGETRSRAEAAEAALQTVRAQLEVAEAERQSALDRAAAVDAARLDAEERVASVTLSSKQAADRASEAAASLRALHAASEDRLGTLQAQMATIVASRSWRVTAPMRQLVSSLRRSPR